MEWIITPTTIPTPPGGCGTYGCVAYGCGSNTCYNNCPKQGCVINLAK